VKEPKEIWEAVLGELQVQVSKPNYETWLKDTKGISQTDDLFVIGTANTFAAEWLQSRLLSLIKNTLAKIIGELVEVQFTVLNRASQVPAAAGQYDGGVSVKSAPRSRSNSLNPRFTFANFVTGDSNRLAYQAACEAASDPGHVHNPLFVYGATGLGKTHLLHAIGNKIRNSRNIIYASAEQMTSEFIKAIKHQETDELNERYRNADVLLLDDFQFFDGKKQTQQYFFHLFNELYDNDCQIVITCDCAPRAITSLTAKLCSRLECGLVADIKAPEYETRLSFLGSRAENAKMTVPAEVLQFIATHCHRNIRELEGGLNRVASYAKLHKREPDLEMARQSLEAIMDMEAQNGNGPSPVAVLNAVADRFELSPRDLTGKGRERNNTQARQIAMYILREHAGYRLSEIGKFFGGRDHSTVIYSCNKIASEINVDKKLSKFIHDIFTELKINKPPAA
jgi:chromosomal replication initiator protein